MLSDKQIAYITRNGHTLHADRSTYTHSLFWNEVKGLAPGQEILEDGDPIWVERLGRTLRVSDVLPERLALAVDARGELLRQSDFHSRYIQYLRGFGADAKRVPELEPIPERKNFLMKQLDPSRPPSNGKAWYVELGFDPRRPAEVTMKAEWHPDGVKMEEWKRRNPELAATLLGNTSSARDAKVQMLIELNAAGKLDSDTLRVELSKLYAVGTVAEVSVEASPGGATDVPVTTAPVMATAPCGKEVKWGYVNVHKRHCKDPACTGEGATSLREQ